LKIATATAIDASPARVWDVMTDVERWHEWTQSITSIERLDGGPFSLGSRARIRQPGLPTVVWQVTAFEPVRYFAWESRGPGAKTIAGHRVEPRDEGAQITLTLEQTGPLGRLFGALLARKSRRYVGMELQGLKARCEGAA
jgi:hypothetical protein